MKTVATIFFIFFIGTAASAQDSPETLKVETIEMRIVTETAPIKKMEVKQEVARLYRFKNSRVKKELSFTTKANSPKMA
ncbi:MULTISPECIES: hypothetical protein [Maribacter]|uniref:Uncharacterized protein n=1 Tax=Maribacter flavus TaxID=1658664 RepID=A0A5B2TV36_9FLAO|nr:MULTISPECIES: hypothetical protein [Maribacter]KAA2218094.1 hypothetical protein F0361_00280 [Maribacter flavus]MDC6406569.1 hypothetical protein [Maribacter sp. PR66]